MVIMMGRNRRRRCLKDCFFGTLAFGPFGLQRKVDHHDRVLFYDSDQQDHSDERDDIEILSEQQQREQRAYAR